jgi:hypothetical protein
MKLDPNIVKPVVGMILLIALGLVWVLSDRSAHPPAPRQVAPHVQ